MVAKWLSTLEKTLEAYSEGSHDNYRVYMSAEPAGSPDSHIIPQGILESSIKITNEPPTGMLANLHQALDNFNQVGISAPLAFFSIQLRYSVFVLHYERLPIILKNIEILCIITKP